MHFFFFFTLYIDKRVTNAVPIARRRKNFALELVVQSDSRDHDDARRTFDDDDFVTYIVARRRRRATICGRKAQFSPAADALANNSRVLVAKFRREEN